MLVLYVNGLQDCIFAPLFDSLAWHDENNPRSPTKNSSLVPYQANRYYYNYLALVDGE
jgi:hypothetical protein